MKKALNMSPALAGKRIFNEAAVKHNGISSFNGTSTVLDISCLKQTPRQVSEQIIDMHNIIIYFRLNPFIISMSSIMFIFTKTKYKNIKVIRSRIIFFI